MRPYHYFPSLNLPRGSLPQHWDSGVNFQVRPPPHTMVHVLGPLLPVTSDLRLFHIVAATVFIFMATVVVINSSSKNICHPTGIRQQSGPLHPLAPLLRAQDLLKRCTLPHNRLAMLHYSVRCWRADRTEVGDALTRSSKQSDSCWFLHSNEYQLFKTSWRISNLLTTESCFA